MLLNFEKINKKVQPLIEEFRARRRSGMITQSQELPIPPPEVEEFQKQRIAVTEQAIEKLKQNNALFSSTNLNKLKTHSGTTLRFREDKGVIISF